MSQIAITIGAAFFLLAANANLSSVTVTSPENNASIIIPAVTPLPVPVTFTAQTDSPADTVGLRYVLDGDTASPLVVHSPVAPPYAATIADASTLVGKTVHTVQAVAASLAVPGQPLYSALSSFTVSRAVANADSGGLGGASDGIPDNPFDPNGLNLGENQQWRSLVSVLIGGVTHYRQVVVLGLGAGMKAIDMPAGGFVATIQDPSNPARVASVTVQTGLLQAGEKGALLMVAGDTVDTVTGPLAPAHPIFTPPAGATEIVVGGAYIEVSVVISTDNGATLSEIDPARLAASPLVLTMEGLSVVAGANARFFSFDSTVSSTPPLVATPVSSGVWKTLSNGTLVENGKMTARLTELSIFAPATTPNDMSITSLSAQTGPCVGGTSVDVVVANMPAGTPVVTFDDVSATITNIVGGVITVTVPRAKNLATPATSKTVDVQVTVGSSTDIRPGAFTYTGPVITGGSGTEGPETGGTPVTVDGLGFDVGPAGVTTADLGGVPILIAGGNTSTHFAGTTGPRTPGLVALTVKTANNYFITIPDAFLYTTGAPTLTGVIPPIVYNDGDYIVRLKGTLLLQQTKALAAKAFFTDGVSGSPNPATDQPATSLVIWDDSNADIVTPAHATGASKVYIAWQAAGRPTILTNVIDFTFTDTATAAYSIARIVPNSGSSRGGNAVEIRGSGFPLDSVPSVKVLFGAREAVVVSVAPYTDPTGGDSVITCIVPAGERVGAVDIRVEHIADATKFAVSRTVKGYEGEGGYTYTSPLLLSSIYGYVRDASTHLPISGARVTATMADSHFAATSSSGVYYIPDLYPGGYFVSVSAPGYVTQTRVVYVLMNGAEWADFSLVTVPEDINGDGKTDAVDIQLVINAALGLCVGSIYDVNHDGKADALDIQLVINKALGL